MGRDTLAITLNSTANELTNRLDELYKRGQVDKWPKEVMDYLMWWEHETCRIAYRLSYLSSDLKKELDASEKR